MKKTSLADSARFYPLKAYFQEQARHIAAGKPRAYLIRTKDGHKDSLPLSREALQAFFQILVDRAIPDTAQSRYRESVFEDLGTASITINYSPLGNSQSSVQQEDILLDQSTQQVKRVFIRSVYAVNDTLVREQCSWKAGTAFEINLEKTWPDHSLHTELQSVHWPFE
ncbi:MAG TPA: hypothetical protein VG842_12475 [Sediminibacterium sp.]|nr:hypothetical protein [Sediminibacterium sp.]